MRRVHIVAHQLERVIGLDGDAYIDVAAVKQRPAAMVALDRAQIVGKLALHHIVDVAEIMVEQNVFGRDGGIRLQLVGPVPIGRLAVAERAGDILDGRVE